MSNKGPAAKNIHGDRTFIVKMQVPLDPAGGPLVSADSCYIYDELRSFAVNPKAPRQIMDLVHRDPTFGGCKSYFLAKCEGIDLLLFTKQRLGPSPGDPRVIALLILPVWTAYVQFLLNYGG